MRASIVSIGDFGRLALSLEDLRGGLPAALSRFFGLSEVFTLSLPFELEDEEFEDRATGLALPLPAGVSGGPPRLDSSGLAGWMWGFQDS